MSPVSSGNCSFYFLLHQETVINLVPIEVIKQFLSYFAGPTDLSMKNTTTKPLLSHKLSSTEMIAVRQLITGYRESAAFLLRSADELEQLLINQP